MQRVAFMGSKALGLVVLRAIVDVIEEPHRLVGAVCAEDRADPRSNRAEFADFADRAGLELIDARTTAEAISALRRWRASVAIVSGWYRLLPVGEVQGCSFYGMHPSLLPRYRGQAPLVWQIIRGEPEIGLSLFKFDEGLDTGDIVAQASFQLAREEAVGEALARVEERAASLIREHLVPLLEGSAVLRAQDHSQATYCGPRRSEDGAIDWRLPAGAVHDFVRAQSRPYPGAYCWLGAGHDRRRVTLWRTAVHREPFMGVPGRMCRVAAGEVIAACGEGAVRVLEAEIDGEAPMSGEELYVAASRTARTSLLR